MTQFVLGLAGMPRRYMTYSTTHQTGAIFKQMHSFSSIGAIILGIGIGIMFTNLIVSIFTGKKAPKNPWGATTLDWETQSPPVHENFVDAPALTRDPYHY